VFWDNLNTHISAAMRTFIAARTDWLTVVRLPAYARELNPTEGVWANMKNGLGNLAAHGIDHFAAIVKNRLKRINTARPHQQLPQPTGLSLEPEPP